MAKFDNFKLTDAQNRIEQVYDIYIDGWGLSGDASFRQYPRPGRPNLQVSPAALVIGNRSDVDRAWISWNLGVKGIDGSAPLSPTALMRHVSVQAPLLFTQAASDGVMPQSADPADAMINGLLAIWSWGNIIGGNGGPIESTNLPATYLKVDGTTEAFTTAANGVFVAPFLHVQILLQGALMTPPAARRPSQRRAVDRSFTGIAATETTVALIPTFGRRTINIQMACDSIADFRVGALRAINDVVAVQETTEGLKTAIAANTSCKFQLCEPGADYIALYVTPTDADVDVDYTVTCYD